MIAEAEAAEAEKRQAAVEEHEAKVIELQANIETLRAVSSQLTSFWFFTDMSELCIMDGCNT